MKKRYYAAVLLGISLSLSGAAGSFADQAAAQECVDVTVEEEATGCGETEQEETRDTSDKTKEQTIVPVCMSDLMGPLVYRRAQMRFCRA